MRWNSLASNNARVGAWNGWYTAFAFFPKRTQSGITIWLERYEWRNVECGGIEYRLPTPREETL